MTERGRRALESALEGLAVGAGDAEHAGTGLFGPASVAWRLCRERAIVLMAPRAVMLQYAHPAFAAASHHYGTASANPGARFSRAIHTLLGMIFGDTRTAVKHARRVERLHGTLSGVLEHGSPAMPAGSAWSAEDPASLAWVLVTLVDAVLRGADLALGRVSDADARTFLSEARTFGRLFAVPPDALPESRAALDAMIDRVAASTLCVGPETRAMWSFLGAEADPSRRARLRGHLVQRWAASTLPEQITGELGIRVGRAERTALAIAARSIARSWTHLGTERRFVTAYVEAAAPGTVR